MNNNNDMIAKLIFAHGAGNDMESDFMQTCQKRFAEHKIDCHLFNFPYMVKAKELGKRRPPDRIEKLLESFKEQIAIHSDDQLPFFIGGKSMGGRIASLLLEEQPAEGGICFGYPFHPPGKPEKTRTEHLISLTKPLFIVQGERDPFGKPEEIKEYELSEKVQLAFLPDGEHSFKTLKKSKLSSEQNLDKAVELAASFINKTLDLKK